MPPRPSHKRAAGSQGEGASGSAKHAPKKTRFTEPAEDPANFAEQVDSALEDPSARSKRRVKNEGYDSDSSDEGESVVRSRRKEAAAEDDDDDDMFAAGEKEDKGAEESAKKKKEEYLRLGDIEGQEFFDEAGSGDESDVSDEPEDEDDAERRKKAGMGFELSSFNMREEMEEGKFTEDGMYVRSFDPHGIHDKWLDGTDERAMKEARRRKRQREKIEREKMKAEERELEQMGGKEHLEMALLPMLKKGESVLEALQRIGTVSKKSQKRDKSKGKGTDTGAPMSVDKPAKGTSPIDHITHIASMLMSLGDADVYSKTYEEVVRSVRSSGKVPPDWEPPSADVKYEYKWDVPGTTAPDGQVFGPFSEDEMKGWYKAVFFGISGEKVKVRTVGGDWGDWDNVVT